MGDAFNTFMQIPGRLLLDTCILNTLYEQGAYIWDGELPDGTSEDTIDANTRALRDILRVNERASFQLVVSPLTIAEVANVQDFAERERLIRWVLDVLDHWLVMLDEIMDRQADGGTVRHRFKLTQELQRFETQLMTIPDLRRDPFDRLLLVQYRMANCDAFITADEGTIWRHRDVLGQMAIRVLRPSEFWEQLKPWAALWV